MPAEYMWVEKAEVPVKPSVIGMELASGLPADVALVVVAMLEEWEFVPDSSISEYMNGICEHLATDTLEQARTIVAIATAAIDATMAAREAMK